jgi:hypothetical protein
MSKISVVAKGGFRRAACLRIFLVSHTQTHTSQGRKSNSRNHVFKKNVQWLIVYTCNGGLAHAVFRIVLERPFPSVGC